MNRSINGLALCAGYGGLELGVHIYSPIYKTVCIVEREAYAASIHRSRMEDKTLDEAPIWGDLRTFDGKPWHGVVDIITAGYPCQPFSTAGKQLGRKDPKHLWPQVARVLQETEAPLLFCENVSAHINLGFTAVVKKLGRMGYTTQAILTRASDLGSPHRRERLFFLAVAENDKGWDVFNLLENSFSKRLKEWNNLEGVNQENFWNKNTSVDFPLWPPGFDKDSDAWKSWRSKNGPEPFISRGVNGYSNRLDRVRACGNGVIPSMAAVALYNLMVAHKK